mgnify:CR=1 FL=1
MWITSCFQVMFGISFFAPCRRPSPPSAALIEQRFPDATPLTGGAQTTEQVATGIGALDQVLPNGGLPRGRLSVWAPQGGATAILRATCYSIVARRRAVGVDRRRQHRGRRVLERRDGLYLVRPKSRLHALRAAEELLRSGGFSLLVLAGTEPQGTEIVRLTRASREGGAALVTSATSASMASLRLTSRLLRYSLAPHAVRRSGGSAKRHGSRRTRAPVGWNAHDDFPIPVTHHELRLSLESELADRRGLPR